MRAAPSQSVDAPFSRGTNVTWVDLSTPTRSAASTRAVGLTREGSIIRLAFPYSAELVAKVKSLAGSSFDSASKTWTVPVCTQIVDSLRGWHLEGLTDVSIDDLITGDDTVTDLPPATLRRGTARRPYVVTTNIRDDRLYSRLRAIAGASWDKTIGGLTYPDGSAAALGELVDRGVIADPEQVLTRNGVVVCFDGRTGTFTLRGDSRAADVFDREFPHRDVMAIWQSKNLDVDFADSLSREVYAGELARNTPVTTPASITTAMFPHQVLNTTIARARSGFLIADEPGVGKTLPGVAVIAEDLHEGVSGRGIVVCPAAVRTHWRSEFSRFTTIDPDTIVIVAGSARKRTAAYDRLADPDDPACILIVHYDVLARDLDQLKPLFGGSTVVFDEAHRLKTRDSARSKAARTLVRGSVRRVLLTGTPVMNDPGEFYTLLDFAVPGALGSWSDYAGRYMYPHPFARGAYTGARNLRELRQRAKVHFTRHTKAQVAEHLPPLRVQTLVLDVDTTLAAALRRAHREARDEIADAAARRGLGRTPVDADTDEPTADASDMTAVGALRMMCTSPRLLHASDSVSADAMINGGLVPDVDGPKIDWVRETAQQMQAAGDRLVVFTFFAKAAALLAERFTSDGVRFVQYTGSTSLADRDAAVEAFTREPTDTDPGPTVFLATDAAAEGLNLGRHCSTLVNLDLPWVPSTLVQRSQRIHRIDGTHPRYRVVNLVLAGTLEAGLLALLENKADIAGAILGESDARHRVTGRRGRASVFEEAISTWSE